jgi:UPF0755 protein
MKKFIYIILAASALFIGVTLLDVYGLTGNTKNVTIEIKENDNLSTLAAALKNNNIINNKAVFKIFFKLNSGSDIIMPGVISVNSKMDYKNIVRLINEPATSSIKITIPEGFEVREIVSRVVNNELVGSADALNSALKNFSYTMKDGTVLSGEKYLLSGYLFPDTYLFYKTSKPEEIIWKMVNNFEKRWTPEYAARAKEINMTMDEVITLASIIEREAKRPEDFPLVSSVFRNRLKIKKPLESCATVQYILQERKAVLSIMNTKIESPYNTYKYPGLPPSPISSPGDLAIKSALYPADTDKLFFFTDKNGINHYSVTYEEHNAQIKKYGL